MTPTSAILGFCPMCGKPADYDSHFNNRLAGLMSSGTFCGDHMLERLESLIKLVKVLEKAKKQSLEEAIKHQQKTAENIQKLMKAGEIPPAPVVDNLTRHTQ